MRVVRMILAASLVMVAGALGCKSSHEEGVKSDLRTQWTTVAADAKTTTEAAKAVLAAQDLKNVTGSSTGVDGTAMAMKADGTKVKVDIEKADNSGCKVSVTVGTLGDPTLGAAIAKQIKQTAENK